MKLLVFIQFIVIIFGIYYIYQLKQGEDNATDFFKFDQPLLPKSDSLPPGGIESKVEEKTINPTENTTQGSNGAGMEFPTMEIDPTIKLETN